jgi:MYXO-CTERM domain-containing protein
VRNQRYIIIFFAFVAALTLGASTTLAAKDVSCENEFGQCKVGQNSESCSCKGGSGSGSTGGSVDTGGDGSGPEKSKEELMAECKELLADMCGGKPKPPKDSVTCKNKFGKCNVDQTGYSCNCIDGPATGGGTGGGTGEPGEPKSTEELMEECQEMLADICGGDPLPPKGKVTCKNKDGECTVSQNFSSCSCKGGAGTGGGGGASDTGGDGGEEKSQEELMEECNEMLADMCGDDPIDGTVTCENENGKCTVGQNSFGCQCKNGNGDGGGTGGFDAGEPDKTKEELMEECEALLKSECQGGGGDDEPGTSVTSGDDDPGSSSDGEDTQTAADEGDGGGDTTTTAGSTDEGSTGGEVGDDEAGTSDEGGDDGAGLDGGGLDDGGEDTTGATGSATGDDGASDESTAGDGADATDADGTDGEAEGSSSSGCVAGPGSHSIWMLLLLSIFALVVWRRRTEINE